jgi:hypothetical protein
MLQKRLEDDLTKPQNEAFKSALIHNVAPFFADLMLDQFGNYLSQKIFEVASFEELVYLTQMIKPCLAEVSMNVHGTRAVQTLIEVLSKDTKKSEKVLITIIDYLRPQIKELSLVSLI